MGDWLYSSQFVEDLPRILMGPIMFVLWVFSVIGSLLGRLLAWIGAPITYQGMGDTFAIIGFALVALALYKFVLKPALGMIPVIGQKITSWLP
jgi:hypothetical protein